MACCGGVLIPFQRPQCVADSRSSSEEKTLLRQNLLPEGYPTISV